MREAFHVHQPEHPGFLRHPFHRRNIGADSRCDTAGVTKQFGHSHHVMVPQAAPAAKIGGRGAKHAGHDVQERGHRLTDAKRIEGKEVGPGRIDRDFPLGQRRKDMRIRCAA